MRTTKLFLLAGAMLLALPIRAEDTPKAETKVEKVDYKDAFLGLALEKTKLYSGKMEDAIGKGVEIAQKEAPELAKEYLTWMFWYHSLYAGVGLAFSFLAICLIFFGYRIARKDDRNNVPVLLLLGLAIGFSCFISGAGNGNHSGWCRDIADAIQIKVAPRIYLIERMAEIVKR